MQSEIFYSGLLSEVFPKIRTFAGDMTAGFASTCEQSVSFLNSRNNEFCCMISDEYLRQQLRTAPTNLKQDIEQTFRGHYSAESHYSRAPSYVLKLVIDIFKCVLCSKCVLRDMMKWHVLILWVLILFNDVFFQSCWIFILSYVAYF